MLSGISADSLGRDSDFRVLIVCPGTLRDTLCASPVAAAIHEAFPRASVAWLAEGRAATVARAIPGVDEVLEMEPQTDCERLLREGRLMPLYGALRTHARRLRAGRFAVALDMLGTLKSRLYTRLTHAPRRFTPQGDGRWRWLLGAEPVTLPLRPTRLTQASLAMLAPLGITPAPCPPLLTLSADARLAAREFLGRHALITEPFVACSLASRRPGAPPVWPHWGALADLLWEQERLRTVFVSGPSRRADILGLVESCASKPVVAAGHLTALQSAALLQEAVAVVGCDCGLTYTGLAAGCPTVVLHGATDPTWLADEPDATLCFHPLPCAPCDRYASCTHHQCMQAITPQDVATSLRMQLSRVRVSA